MSSSSTTDLISLVDNYQAPQAARDLVVADPPTLLVGITGAGKDTTKGALLATGEFADIVSHTTRAPRLNNGELEKDGVAYHFVTHDQMAGLVADGAFIEVKRVHGTDSEPGDIYGTSIAELEKARTAGKIPLTDVDVKGIREYKKLADNTVAIFILPPDYDTWRARLATRYASPAELDAEWPKRSRTAAAELQEALSLPYYHFIINDSIDRTAQVASEIAHRGDVFKRGDDEARLAARDLLAQILERA